MTKIWERTIGVRETQEMRDAGLIDAKSIREAALRGSNKEYVLVEKISVEGAIDCLKSYLRSENCAFETDKCMNGCRCVDMAVINGLKESLS